MSVRLTGAEHEDTDRSSGFSENDVSGGGCPGRCSRRARSRVRGRKRRKSGDVTISSVAYTPDLGLSDSRHSHSRRSRSRTRSGSRESRPTPPSPFRCSCSVSMDSGPRRLNGNVLEAAMLSLEAHPDPGFQAIVDAARRRAAHASRAAVTAASRSRPRTTATTGKRDLLDGAIKAADALYPDFKTNNPPFSGGERDAVNCLQLYRRDSRQETSRSAPSTISTSAASRTR